jgi:hypothetical protein
MIFAQPDPRRDTSRGQPRVAVAVREKPQAPPTERHPTPKFTRSACEQLLNMIGLVYDANIGRALQARDNISMRARAGIETEERLEAAVLVHVAGRMPLDTVIAKDRGLRMLDGAEAAAAEFHRLYGHASADLQLLITVLGAIEWRNPETRRLNMLRNLRR